MHFSRGKFSFDDIVKDFTFCNSAMALSNLESGGRIAVARHLMAHYGCPPYGCPILCLSC